MVMSNPNPPEQPRPVTFRSGGQDSLDMPATPEERATDSVPTDSGYIPIANFDGAAYADPQPELPDDAVSVVMKDGRTVAVDSIDLYYGEHDYESEGPQPQQDARLASQQWAGRN